MHHPLEQGVAHATTLNPRHAETRRHYLTGALAARGLGAGVVIAHVSTDLQGDGRAPGQVRSTLMTLVIERRDTQWKIIAAHNTNVVASPA